MIIIPYLAQLYNYYTRVINFTMSKLSILYIINNTWQDRETQANPLETYIYTRLRERHIPVSSIILSRGISLTTLKLSSVFSELCDQIITH